MKRQPSISFMGIDSNTPTNEVLSAKYMQSFAYFTVKDRLPVILTTVVDHLVRNKDVIIKYQGVLESDLKDSIGKISKLKNEVQTNKTFVDLTSNADDVDEWNKILALQKTVSETVCWFESPWLYTECYMYRRLKEIFEHSETLKDFDFFRFQKMNMFERSLSDIKTLVTYTLNVVTHKNVMKKDEIFSSLIKASLWGNRNDLSITCANELTETHNNLNIINSLDSLLLHDDSAQVYKLLSKSGANIIGEQYTVPQYFEDGTVSDFVTDNAGYELISDLCFCDFLCSYSMAKTIRFHVKKFPWFVSDATAKDMKWVIDKMKSIVDLVELAKRWETYLSEYVWTIHDEKYWTLPYDYESMELNDLPLYNSLCESDLIIFKGDLNYRKLIREINWEHSTKFDEVLGKFRPSNVLAMRTIKSDLACGIMPNKTKHLSSDLLWMRTGEYAVIQLCKKQEP